MSKHHILFSKDTVRNVSNLKIESQISMMGAKAHGRLLAQGASIVDTRCTSRSTDAGYVFDAAFIISANNGLSDHHIAEIVATMNNVGSVYGWKFIRSFKDEGSDTVNVTDAPIVTEDEEFDDSSIDLGDATPYFSHLYERNAQISVVLSAVAAAKSTRFAHRFHSVLFGEPGCGKTAITSALAKMIGEENVLRFDGPSCTKAGLENFFLEGDDISGPKIMIFEEIEKADGDAHKVLLSMLDERSEVRKTTGDEGQRVQDVKVLCLATVNNMTLFNKLYAGALSSRFTHKIQCPRPTRKGLENILKREVNKCGGDEAWIAPALDYVLNVECTTDPRRAIAVCLSGRERLLTGAYQKALRSIASKN